MQQKQDEVAQSITQSAAVLAERGMVATPPPPARPLAQSTTPAPSATQTQDGSGSAAPASES